MEFSELWGRRESKYQALERSTSATVDPKILTLSAPYHFFVPKDFSLDEEWQQWPSIREIMPINATGVKTHLDDVLVGFTKQQVEDAVGVFVKENWRAVEAADTKRASSLRKAVLLKRALKDAEGQTVHSYGVPCSRLSQGFVPYRPRSKRATIDFE